MTATPEVPQHDFLAAALVPTNEQRIVSSLDSIDATLKSFEKRLFAFINSMPKAPEPTKGRK